MKKIIVLISSTLFTSLCLAQMTPETMYQRKLNQAIWLATEINMPTTSNSENWTEPLFMVNSVIITNGFKFVKQVTPIIACIDCVVYTNDQIIAGGSLYERATFDEARTALLLHLLNNNMMVEALAMIYKIRTNDVGDFKVVRTTKNSSNEIIDRMDWICFIRGSKAVNLRGNDGINVQPIAETLDMLLKNPPAK